MKLGLMQGRLLPPIDNHIQEFPKSKWKIEFAKLKSLTLDHIEWILTSRSIKEGALNLNIKCFSSKISSICCDHLITDSIFNPNFFHQQVGIACDFALRNNVKNITIPLLDSAELNHETKKYFFTMVEKSLARFKNLNFLFEVDCDSDLALKLSQLNKNFFLTFDTGNITSSKRDVDDWFSKNFIKIKNVHLKDRTINPVETVEPFTGDVNFDKIFEILAKNKYNHLFTIQTARGDTGKEDLTIARHIRKFDKLYNEKII